MERISGPTLESSAMSPKPRLNDELDRLQEHLPGWMARVLSRVRAPSAKLVRLPVAGVLMVGGVFGFLPILGFWMVPLGLALLALDVPPLRGPLARLLALINRKLSPAR